MDELNKDQPPQGMHMGHSFGCMCGYGHRHFWLRWLLGIIILVVVFALGVCLGSFHSSFERGGEHGGYDINRQGEFMFRGYPGMMQANPVMMQSQSGTSTPK